MLDWGDWCPYKERIQGHTGEGRVHMAHGGRGGDVPCPQAKESQGSLVLAWSPQRAPALPTPSFRNSPELWENTFVLFKPPSWWQFVTAATGSSYGLYSCR